MSDAQLSGRSHGFRNALVIHNPTAGPGRRRRLGIVLAGLKEMGCTHTLLPTRGRGDAEDAARRAGGQGFDLVVVAGGDGTVNEAVNGLAAAESPLPLALVPLGTANVLAAEIGLPTAPKAVLAAIGGGRRRKIHLGCLDGRHFVLMASAGVDAAVVHGVDLALKRRTGKLAYAIEAVSQGLSYGFPELVVTVDGAIHTARMAVACRAGSYGGPFKAAPDADLGDEFLHVVLLKTGGLPALLRYGAALASGRLARRADVAVVRGRMVVIEGPAQAPVQADGDPLGTLPAALSVSELTLELVVP